MIDRRFPPGLQVITVSILRKDIRVVASTIVYFTENGKNHMNARRCDLLCV